MMEKARTATDPLSHNPIVYYRQAKYFSCHQDHANTLFYLSLALDANMEEADVNIGSLIMSTQALSLAKVNMYHRLSQKNVPTFPRELRHFLVLPV